MLTLNVRFSTRFPAYRLSAFPELPPGLHATMEIVGSKFEITRDEAEPSFSAHNSESGSPRGTSAVLWFTADQGQCRVLNRRCMLTKEQVQEEELMGDDRVCDILAMLIGAGSDTTSSYLQSFFKVIALHPHVMHKAQEGIRNSAPGVRIVLLTL